MYSFLSAQETLPQVREVLTKSDKFWLGALCLIYDVSVCYKAPSYMSGQLCQKPCFMPTSNIKIHRDGVCLMSYYQMCHQFLRIFYNNMKTERVIWWKINIRASLSFSLRYLFQMREFSHEVDKTVTQETQYFPSNLLSSESV